MRDQCPPWVIFHVPHDSMLVPSEVRRQITLTDGELDEELIKMTDHLTLLLFASGAPEAQVIRAPASRLVVDVERFADDRHEPMADRGMGAVYSVTSSLKPLRRPLFDGERDALMLAYYRPHHARLEAAVSTAIDLHGRCLVIDCHSFPSLAHPYEFADPAVARPDICIGTDTFHTSGELAIAFVSASARRMERRPESTVCGGIGTWKPVWARPPRQRRHGRDQPSALPSRIRCDTAAHVCNRRGTRQKLLHGGHRSLQPIGKQVMAKSKKTAPQLKVPAEPITEFEVTEGGTLCMADYAEAETRAEFYEDVADRWEGSPQDLSDAMDECQPLAWAVHPLYADFREELEADIQGAEDQDKPNRRKIAALKARLEAMPEEPFDGASEWLLGLTTAEFQARIVPSIQAWFAEPPDWSFEDDYLPESGTAQGAALEFFRSMDANSVDLLGVDIVEGEHPGSTYYAAELRGDIDAANRAAEAAGLRVRFVKG